MGEREEGQKILQQRREGLTPNRSKLAWEAADVPDLSTRPEPWTCPECKTVEQPIWARTRWIQPHVEWEQCEACNRLALGREYVAAQRQALLEKYGFLGGQYEHMRFETYKPQNQSQIHAKRMAIKCVDTWKRGDWRKGIMLYSPLTDVGVGKTHLAIAMAYNALMMYKPDLGKTAVAIHDWPGYIDEIKQTFETGGTERLKSSVREPGVLVLDDLGAEYANVEWNRSLLYEIFNARWLRPKATIVTTNLNIDELSGRVGPRVLSRMIDLTGLPIKMTGDDYRLRDLA